MMALDQLNFLQSILTGAGKDKSKLHAMNLGVLAYKEFDSTEPELAIKLSNVNYISSKISSGMKVILPHEEDVKYIKRHRRNIK
ncbi:immunity protein Tsi6 family protein [Erwinia sp. HDF1-3R]|uniref:immunity protein Tsi6 family protein n=1 Tax=Erwinia sp. HDF1-3R TaxID=3141543 RepID=UPI0031F51E4B